MEPSTVRSEATGTPAVAPSAPETEPGTAPAGGGLAGRPAAGLVASLLVAVVAFQLGASMVTPALPAMAATLGVGADDVAGVSSYFFLAGAVAGVVLSRWSDYVGRRRILLATLLVMVGGTVVCLLATSLPLLLAGRVMQGTSSAVFQISYIILAERLSPRVFGTALGVVTAINGGVGGVDGFVGGLLTDHFGYRSIFVAILAVGLLALVFVLRVVPRGERPADTGTMDWWGAAALSITIVCLTQAVDAGSASGWASPRTLGLLAATALAAAGFWAVERRRRTPLFPLRHLRSREVWPLVATTMLTLTGVFAVINFTVVVLSQDTAAGYGMSASLSALAFLAPPALIGLFAGPVAGWLAGRRGWVAVLRWGLVLCLAVLVVIALMPTHRWVVLGGIACLGVAYNGLFMATANGLGVLQSPPDAPGALPGLNSSAFGIGAGLGIGLVAPFVAQGTVGGYATALWVSAGITALALGTSLLLVPRPAAMPGAQA
ncbi:MFS transporter [Isoptericola sp. BMS4]|uniref:MFS transporter n=1 Tax=Isoptericola sp. BMS4 TaxID=2527875 RepID=UPI0014215EFF|nr:MFS transporter [Isoptericola sp. BMS4]